MSVKDAGAVRLVATLSLAGLAAGLLLVGVYLVTKPRIDRNRAEALERAILNVVPGARGFETLILEGGELVAADPARVPDGAPVVYRATGVGGEAVGWAIPGKGSGFQDVISLIYGFDSERRVIVGMEVLESRETPGLGDKIIFDPTWLSNFEALEVEPTIVPVSSDPGPNEVDTISGATISSKAVVNILNQSMGVWLPVLTRDGVPSRDGES